MRSAAAAADAGGDRDGRDDRKEPAPDEQPDPDPDQRIELGTDAELGGHATRSVGVHDDGIPAAVLGFPLERLLPRSGRRGSPERVVPGRALGCGTSAFRVARLAAYLGDDGVLDAAQVLGDLRLARDTDEHRALAL